MKLTGRGKTSHDGKSRLLPAFGVCSPLVTENAAGLRLSRPGQSADWPARAKLRKQFCGLDGWGTVAYLPPGGARPLLSEPLTAAAPFLLAGLELLLNAVPHVPGRLAERFQSLAPARRLVALI